MKVRGYHYIDGRWRPGGGMPLVSIDPATGQEVWKGYTATSDEVDSAISAARQALPRWANLSLSIRCDYLQRFAIRLQDEADLIATSIAYETGKPLWEAKGEVAAMVAKVEISIRAYGDRCKELRQEGSSSASVTRHRPHGVVAVFGPFNFPGHLPNGHIIPALLAGNVVVFKPSEMTPLVAERVIEIWHEVGIPSGVLNLIQGGRDTGQALAQHQGIDGLFFTGSGATGHVLSKHFAMHPGKILALELGGNNPLVVTEVTDLPAAAYTIVVSAFLSAGQRCTCARRLILPRGEKGDALLEKVMALSKSLKVGPCSDDPEPFMGPLISGPAAKSVEEAQARYVEIGAKMLLPMERSGVTGAFLTPGIVDVTRLSQRPDEEIFGPLLQVVRVENLDRAIEEANRTAYGLSAGLLSDSSEEWHYFLQHIRAGVVNWNTMLTGASSQMPFGGVGHSGNHRPSAYYAADYCAYPVASIESEQLSLPESLMPGVEL